MTDKPVEEIFRADEATWGADTQAVYRRAVDEFDAERAIQEQIGTTLRDARERSGLSQARIAELADVQQADLSRIERGLGNPTSATLGRLARALGTPITIYPASGS